MIVDLINFLSEAAEVEEWCIGEIVEKRVQDKRRGMVAEAITPELMEHWRKEFEITGIFQG